MPDCVVVLCMVELRLVGLRFMVLGLGLWIEFGLGLGLGSILELFV